MIWFLGFLEANQLMKVMASVLNVPSRLSWRSLIGRFVCCAATVEPIRIVHMRCCATLHRSCMWLATALPFWHLRVQNTRVFGLFCNNLAVQSKCLSETANRPSENETKCLTERKRGKITRINSEVEQKNLSFLDFLSSTESRASA